MFPFYFSVRHIINVTREIDNFFPGIFNYFNIRVYDDDKTNLLKYWDNTYKYITRAKSEGSKVLVHCKMGVSRSASVVIAYAMKAYNWDFHNALDHVKRQRSCIKPNKNFMSQLETYNGMLDAMKNKDKLQRSKSETNLKSNANTKDARLLPGSEPTPLIQALNASQNQQAKAVLNSPKKIIIDKKHFRRANSMSPKRSFSDNSIIVKQQSQSLESLTTPVIINEQKNVRYPGSNGQNYSVTQNQILEIQKPGEVPPSVKTIVKDLESKKTSKTKNKKTLDLQAKYNFGRSMSTENNNICSEVVTWSSSTQLIHQCTTDHRSKVDKLSNKRKSTNEPRISSINLPSRHSSWGSGDDRSAILPRIFKSSTINEENLQKSVSSNPGVFKKIGGQQHNRCNSEDICVQLSNRKDNQNFIQNRPRSYELCFPSTTTNTYRTENNCSINSSKSCSSTGNVQILKQNFEAKAKGKSLPSSPIATHISATNATNPTDDQMIHTSVDECNFNDSHDFSVQGLVNKYQTPESLPHSHSQTTQSHVTTNQRPKSFYGSNLSTVESKYYKRSNSLRSNINNNRSPFQHDQDNINIAITKKPPPFMTVLSSPPPPQHFPTISTNFATQPPQTDNIIRQQHGKTHPLSKLSHRIKSAAFNTM